MEGKYNTIDDLVTKIMKDGEQQCMTKKKYNTPWSTALMAEAYKLYYWSLKISGIKKPWRHKEKRVQKAAMKANIQDLEMSLEIAIGHRAEARKEMRMVLEKAKELRRSELEERARAYADAGNMTMESAIIELINKEKIRILGGK